MLTRNLRRASLEYMRTSAEFQARAIFSLTGNIYTTGNVYTLTHWKPLDTGSSWKDFHRHTVNPDKVERFPRPDLLEPSLSIHTSRPATLGEPAQLEIFPPPGHHRTTKQAHPGHAQ